MDRIGETPFEKFLVLFNDTNNPQRIVSCILNNNKETIMAKEERKNSSFQRQMADQGNLRHSTEI